MPRQIGVHESRGYARRAIRRLLVIGEGKDVPVELQIDALCAVLECCGEDLTPLTGATVVGFKQGEEE